MAGHVLRLRLPYQQLLDSNLRMLAALKVLESGDTRSLHQLHSSRPCLRCHEHSLGFNYFYITAPNSLGAEIIPQREIRGVADIHEWSHVR